MELTLSMTREEATILDRVLKSYVSNLGSEIGDADNHDWRKTMQADEAIVKKLILELAADLQLAADEEAMDRWADEAGTTS